MAKKSQYLVISVCCLLVIGVASFAVFYNQTAGAKKELCAQVYTMSTNPSGTQCRGFRSPCDVPTGWKQVDYCGNVRFCIQVMTPAINPQTKECTWFPTPCDVPQGWHEVSQCPLEVVN